MPLLLTVKNNFEKRLQSSFKSTDYTQLHSIILIRLWSGYVYNPYRLRNLSVIYNLHIVERDDKQ